MTFISIPIANDHYESSYIPTKHFRKNKTSYDIVIAFLQRRTFTVS